MVLDQTSIASRFVAPIVRRSLAVARPVLRTFRDLGNVRAYARSLMLR